MGVCYSCLGINRRRPSEESGESARLLPEDQHSGIYGALNGGHSQPTTQVDLQHLQRETEALQKIVLQTSDNLIDIFALHPQPVHSLPPAPFYSSASSKSLRYQRLLQKITLPDDSSQPKLLAPNDITNEERIWIEELGREAEEVVKAMRTVNTEDVGVLVSGLHKLGEYQSSAVKGGRPQLC